MAEAAGANVNADQNAIQFSLADGGSMTLSGLPVGYFLQVQESAPGFAAYQWHPNGFCHGADQRDG